MTATTSDGWWGLRLLAGSVALLATALVVWNVPSFIQAPGDTLLLLIMVPSSIAAVLGWWFAFDGQKPATREVLWHACVGGMFLGATAFVVGFVGPMVFAPEANQGPLLGIFITGPMGFAVGALGGLTVGLARRRIRRQATE